MSDGISTFFRATRIGPHEGLVVRSTVVGNYPRVDDTHEGQRLRRGIGRREKGEIEREELRAIELSILQEVVREQVAAGVDVVTDGQVTWYDSQSHFAARLDGFEITGLVRYFDTNTYYRQPRVTGRVRWTAPITVEDWKAGASASQVPVKAVVTGPYTLAALAANAGAHEKTVLLDLAAALGREVAALVAAGATHVQIDEPAFVGRKSLPAGYADAVDALLEDAGSAETTLFTHFGGVGPILVDLLALPFDVLGLDLVQGADALAALRAASVDKGIAFGLIDARNTKLEDPTAVASQVSTFADCVALDRSYLSPSNGLEFLPRGKAREKLRVLVAAARAVGEAG